MLKRRAKATRLRLIYSDSVGPLWLDESAKFAKLSATNPTGHSVSCHVGQIQTELGEVKERGVSKNNTWFCFFYSDLWALRSKKPNPSPIKRSRNHFKSPFARSTLQTRRRFDLRIKMDVK